MTQNTAPKPMPTTRYPGKELPIYPRDSFDSIRPASLGTVSVNPGKPSDNGGK